MSKSPPPIRYITINGAAVAHWCTGKDCAAAARHGGKCTR